MNSFKTEKGTELPLLNLKGKDYLQAAHRILWFREVKPEWSIETEFVRIEPDYAIAKCTVKNEAGRIIATAHKLEDRKGFPDFHEKCETGSISRALALCGFGTQFAQELDEGERLSDAPIKTAFKNNPLGNQFAYEASRNPAGPEGVKRSEDLARRTTASGTHQSESPAQQPKLSNGPTVQLSKRAEGSDKKSGVSERDSNKEPSLPEQTQAGPTEGKQEQKEITAQDRKRLTEIALSTGWTRELVTRELQRRYNKNTTTELKDDQFWEFYDLVKNNPQRKAST
jgi:hypothetical protein